MIFRTYSELITFATFEERYRYLKLEGRVGEETFGFDRYLNQLFYKTDEWKLVRNHVITRDNGCDLGVEGHDRILIHHLNPISKEDILERKPWILDPEFLISTAKNTHDAIHYGDEGLLVIKPKERFPNDTCPWKH